MAKTKAKTKQRLRGPFLAGAFFCEKHLEEKDDLPSFIRVMDIVTVEKPQPIPAVPGQPVLTSAVELILVLMIKAGDVTGSVSLRLDTVFPSGKRKKSSEQEVQLLGGASGATLRGSFPHPVDEEGLYWHEFRIDRRLLTRIPLTVEYQRHAKPADSPPPSPGPKGKA